MDILILILSLLLAIGTPIIWIVFAIKRKTLPAEQISGPVGPRQRDGVLTYNADRGRRFNVKVEDPRSTHNQRYQRRHASRKQKPTKPWMK